MRGVWGLCLGGVSCEALPVPIPGQKFVNAVGGVIRQSGQRVGQPRLRIDIVEFGGGDRHFSSISAWR